jgi:hypothetical protein
MSEENTVGGPADKETPLDSVAIVAMGVSNQSWFKRSYNGDNYEFFSNIFKKRFDVVLPQKGDLENRLLEAFKDQPLSDTQRQWISDAAEQFSPDKEAQKIIDSASDAMGREATIREIGEPFQEVWAINHMGKVLRDVDMVVLMDDLRVEKHRYTDLLLEDTPILTSKAYPEYPASVEYPINDVVNDMGWMYLTNSVVYAVAFAMLRGAKRIGLFGCDFHYPGAARSEQARANCEFLLGIAHERGIALEIPPGSTTMDMHVNTKFYGYAEQPEITRADGVTLHCDGGEWKSVDGD